MTTLTINKKSGYNILSIDLSNALSIIINADLIETAIDDFKNVIKMLITASGSEIDPTEFASEEFNLLIYQLVSVIESTEYMNVTIKIDSEFNMSYEAEYSGSINIKKKIEFLKKMYNI